MVIKKNSKKRDLPAKGKSPATTYLKQVKDSDIYIGIIGYEYGTKGKDNFSATEREFRHFLRSGSHKEILIFIKGEIFSNRKFRQLFKVTNKTASTDLNALVKMGMAQIKGRGRSGEYLAK